MKYFLLILISLGFVSCQQEAGSTAPVETQPVPSRDTIIVKRQKTLSGPNEVGFYSRYYYYNWVVGKDTLPYTLSVSEYEMDGTVSLQLFHKDPMLFSTTLEIIKSGFGRVSEDFDLSKLKYVFFRSPAYYPDLTKQLSQEYEQQFGWKEVGYQKLDQFLLGSTINSQLNELFSPLGMKVTRYGIEKARIMNRESVGLTLDLPEVDFSAYPEYMIHGGGLSVHVTPINK